MQIERTRYHTVHGIIPKINEKYSGFTTRSEKISLENSIHLLLYLLLINLHHFVYHPIVRSGQLHEPEEYWKAISCCRLANAPFLLSPL